MTDLITPCFAASVQITELPAKVSLRCAYVYPFVQSAVRSMVNVNVMQK